MKENFFNPLEEIYENSIHSSKNHKEKYHILREKEAFYIQSTLLQPNIPPSYLEQCIQVLQKRHMDEIFEERFVGSLCGYPPCGKTVSKTKGKYRISRSRRQVYDAREEQQFCSSLCHKNARLYVARLGTNPPHQRPSLMEVFNTSKPNPKDYIHKDLKSNKDKMINENINPNNIPEIKQVWAKNKTLGSVVERPSNSSSIFSQRLKTKKKSNVEKINSQVNQEKSNKISNEIKEIENPTKPDLTFPDTEKACLIEGYIFPSHKNKLAEKAAKSLQSQNHPLDEENVINISDSSDDEIEEDETSSEEEGGDYILSTKNLPLGIQIWNKLSQWRSKDTFIWLVQNDIIQLENSISLAEDNDSKPRSTNAIDQRFTLFCSYVEEGIRKVADLVKISYDVYTLRQISSLVKTFHFYQGIDGENMSEWMIIGLVLLLIVQKKELKDLDQPSLIQTLKNFNIDEYEMKQLLQVLQEDPHYDQIILPSDLDALSISSKTASFSNDTMQEENKIKNDSNIVKQCRKCRRIKDKCLCD